MSASAVAPGAAPAASAQSAEPDAHPIDRIIASVDGDPITMQDLKSFAAQAGSPITTDDIADDENAKAALRGLIDQKLLDAEVKKYANKIDAAQVDRYIQELRNDKHMTEADFRKALMQSGISYDQFRQHAREQLERAMMIDQEVRERIDVPASDIKAYYDEHQDEFRISQERLKLAQVLIAVEPDAPPAQVSAAHKKVEEIREQAVKGTSFGDLARRYSDDQSKTKGGELGWFKPADVMDVILAAVKNLKPGQISQVVRTKYGFHVLKLEDHEVPGVEPLAKVSDQIRAKVIDEKMQSKLLSWVETDLAKRHYVETMY
jgi:parvulin-like peptidyl-prolyl isomerase